MNYKSLVIAAALVTFGTQISKVEAIFGFGKNKSKGTSKLAKGSRDYATSAEKLRQKKQGTIGKTGSTGEGFVQKASQLRQKKQSKSGGIGGFFRSLFSR